MLHRAGDWFLTSGIQQPSGGFARYYRSDDSKYARVSTEITAYAVGALLYVAARTGCSRYADAAVRGARFLTDVAWNSDLAVFPFEHSDNGDQPEPRTYFFDTGIIVRGLLAAWRTTGERIFLHAAVSGGRSMLADFRSRTTIHPILRLPAKEPLAYNHHWSASPGCYQLKAAMAWRELFEETGERRFENAYESALESALATEDSFLPGDVRPPRVMDRLHAYCYFLEGLLPVAGRSDCARALAAGIKKTERYLIKIAPLFVRSDVYAQLLRVRLYATQAGIELDETAASSEASAAADFHVASDDPRTSGGFAFGREGGASLPFVNPVSTAFCLQALAMWSDYAAGEPPASTPRSLI